MTKKSNVEKAGKTTEQANLVGAAPMEGTTSLRDKGIYFLSGNFTPETAHKIVTWILEANFNPQVEYDHLTLIINSPGGEVPSAFAIIDAIEGSAIPVHTMGLGIIGSCGLLTFLAGAKGHRVLTPNTSILSHQWSWGDYGKAHELFATVKQYEIIQNRILNHYQKHTGLNKTQIEEKLLPAHDVWLSAQEALDLGLCDEIKIMGQRK